MECTLVRVLIVSWNVFIKIHTAAKLFLQDLLLSRVRFFFFFFVKLISTFSFHFHHYHHHAPEIRFIFICLYCSFASFLLSFIIVGKSYMVSINIKNYNNRNLFFFPLFRAIKHNSFMWRWVSLTYTLLLTTAYIFVVFTMHFELFRNAAIPSFY